MKRYKAWIFDLYGTLVDIWTDEEDPALWQWLAGFYGCFGAQWDPADINRRYHELVREFEEKIRREKGYEYPEIDLEDVFAALYLEKTQPDADIASFRAEHKGLLFDIANGFRVFSRRRLEAYEGSIELINKLKSKDCRIFLLSNAQAVFTLPEIRATGLDGLFDSVYISSECGMKKPQPQFMQLLLNEQGLDPKNCVMVGNDFQSDMAIAASAGMDAVFINSFGYDEDRIMRENACGAAVFDSIGQLIYEQE